MNAATDAIIVAAGRGTRLTADTPKQFLTIGGLAVARRAAQPFLVHEAIRRVVVVIGPDDAAHFAAAFGDLAAHLTVVVGGATRQASVAKALEALADDPPHAVLIHDGARPFPGADLIARVCDALCENAAVCPGVPVADTIKRVADGRVAATVSRDALVQAQTPQGFHFAALLAAHRAAPDGATDDAAIMEAAGHPVAIVPGARSNFKITTHEDLAAARALTSHPAVGQGFDVHRLEPGGPLTLGGLVIDFDHHLSGHSDADVALHALTDAILGALALGDIGEHFPPTDPAWKGAASDRFLAHAAAAARAAQARILHLDLTIICERPKIGPHRPAMRERIAAIVGVDPAHVSVKATTTERLGFTGRAEGIAAQATATLLVP